MIDFEYLDIQIQINNLKLCDINLHKLQILIKMIIIKIFKRRN